MVPTADLIDAQRDAAKWRDEAYKLTQDRNSWRRVAERLEREKQHLAAALQHVVRDPAVAGHAGWREDAERALAPPRTQDTPEEG